MKTYYDATGTLIHVGEWDFAPFPNLKNETEHANPMPIGVVVKEEEVEFNTDGSISVVSPSND